MTRAGALPKFPKQSSQGRWPGRSTPTIGSWGEDVTERSRRGLVLLPAVAVLSFCVREARADPAERVAAGAPVARAIQQAGDAGMQGSLRMRIVQSAKAPVSQGRGFRRPDPGRDRLSPFDRSDRRGRPSETTVFVVSGDVTVADAAQGASVRVAAGEGTSVAVPAADGPSAAEIWGARRAADALSRTGTE